MKTTLTCVLMVIVAWAVLPSLHAAQSADPRPQMLLIGESSSMLIRGEEAWDQVLRARYPQWKLNPRNEWRMLAGEDRQTPGRNNSQDTWPGAAQRLDELLKGLPAQNLVIVMLGINYSHQGIRSQVSLDQASADLAQLLAALKAHPLTAGAQLALVTPLPIVEAKLDQWSTEPFAGAAAYSAELATRWSAQAATAGAAIIPAHEWVREQGDGGDQVMTAGWMVRWGGISLLGEWLSEQIAALDPQPSDAAAFTQWQREQAAHRELDALLVASGGGRPAHGAPLAPWSAEAVTTALTEASGKKPKGTPPRVFDLPVSVLADEDFSLLIQATGPHLASFGSGSDDWDQPSLRLIGSDGEQVTVKPQPQDWAYISAAHQDRVLRNVHFGVSIGRWRPFPLLDGRSESERAVLMRWRFGAIDRQAISALQLWLPHNSRQGHLQETVEGRASDLRNPGPFGEVSVHLLRAPDSAWTAVATWQTRDGEAAWSGGAVQQEARQEAIWAFLAGDPPPAVAERARQYVGE